MKLEMSTVKLNAILASVEKGVGEMRILPVTGFIKLSLKKGVLSVVATDSINFVTYTEKGYEGDDGECLVKARQLIQLASRTTKDKIKLTLKDTHLEVKGNGTYKIELNTEDEFPEYEFNKKAKKHKVKVSQLKDVFNVNKAAVATDMLMPCLTGFNMGDVSTTTDGVKMIINNSSIIKGEHMLVTQPQAELLKTLRDDEVTIQKDGSKLLFTTTHIAIFGVETDDSDEYPDITHLASLETDNQATVNREELLDALNRLMLFVESTENDGITLEFQKSQVKVKDVKNNSEEAVKYKSKKIKDTAIVNVSNIYMVDLIQALKGAEVTLLYSADEETPLVIKQDEITQLLSVMESGEES